jgi:hypothetical protein
MEAVLHSSLDTFQKGKAMSQQTDGFDPFDPTGMLKTMRDANMDSWARMMIQVVNTEAYAKANGVMLDAWLSSSGPFRKVIEASMAQNLAALNLPSRADFISLAERMTNIEMRLDDMDAKLDEALRGARKGPARGTKPSKEENQS